MIPYGIAAILLFTVPPATPIVKGIYVFITYNFCTTVVYTALNLPYATLATLMTRDTDQRAVVNLFRTGMSALGNMVISAVTFPLVTRLGDTQQAWIEVSILYAIVSIIMLFICFKNCHERVKEETKTKDGKSVPLWMGIKLCVTNKYFIMFFFLAVFLSFYEAVTGTCNAYYAQYILGNRDLLGALASFESIPQIVTVLVLSPFIAKFGKRNVALIGAVVAVIGTVSLFINPSALNLALFACVMRGIGKGCFLCEIQQTSDVTYRIYDFKRKDKNGNYRQLHTKEAAESISYTVLPNYRTEYVPEKNKGITLVQCPYFHTLLYDLSSPVTIDISALDSFVITIVTKGSGKLTDNEGNVIDVQAGDSLIFPAATKQIKTEGRMKLIETYV